jgi:hypothetical protein
MQKATAVFKRDLLRSVSKGESRSPEEAVASLGEAIDSTERMQRAVDEALSWLLKARTEGCFGKDAEQWERAIPVFQGKRDELAASIAEYRRNRSAIEQKYRLSK